MTCCWHSKWLFISIWRISSMSMDYIAVGSGFYLEKMIHLAMETLDIVMAHIHLDRILLCVNTISQFLYHLDGFYQCTVLFQ